MPFDSSARARITTAIVLLLVLGSGVVLGVALDRQLESRAQARGEPGQWNDRPRPEGRDRGFDPRRGSSREAPPERSDRGRRLLVEQVGLTEAQNEKVDSIVEYYRSQMKALHDEFDQAYNTRFREIMQATSDEIKAVLTPDQQVAYDSIRAEWARRREERRQDSAQASGGQVQDEGQGH